MNDHAKAKLLAQDRHYVTAKEVDNLRACYLEQAAQLERLRELARAVVDRWDTPLWKEAPATAEYINALRKELEGK